jgi:hypothetical protein
MLNETIINNIKDIFVELVDVGFVAEPIISNSEIYVNIKPYITLQSEDTFKYEVISEYIIMFIDYVNTIWGDIVVWYDYQYISYDGVDHCNSQKTPPNHLDIVSMRVRIKRKNKENFIKRFLKKFEEVEHNMKYLKRFNENSDFEYDTWEEIISSLDVYQLYELLQFKYGDVLTDTKQEIDEEEGDYNPDHIYETIEYELKAKDLFTDFITNWQQYQIEKDEADPFHWRHRNKSYNDLLSKWGDMK